MGFFNIMISYIVGVRMWWISFMIIESRKCTLVLAAQAEVIVENVETLQCEIKVKLLVK